VTTVARNIAAQGTATFDGTHPTNGFHPLWQYLLDSGAEDIGEKASVRIIPVGIAHFAALWSQPFDVI